MPAGHSHLKVVWGCAPVMIPLFSGQSALPSLPICHQRAPHFQFSGNFCIFSLVLAKISALKMQIFKIFVPKTPHFSRKIHPLDPTFGNLCGTHPPKKKLSASPPPRCMAQIEIQA